MRVDLQGSDHTLTLLSPEELIEFRSEADARSFLSQFLIDPSNMATLRKVLADEASAMFVARLNDHDVIAEIAKRLVRVMVGVVRADLPPVAPPDAAEGDFISDLIEMVAPLFEDDDSPPIDLKPKPIVPPEFPTLAKMEADATEYQSVVYTLKLDLLRFRGGPNVPESVISEALVEIAGGAKAAMSDTVKIAATSIKPLATLAGDIAKVGQIGQTFKSVAVQTGKELANTAAKAGELVKSVLGPVTDNKAKTEVGPALKDLSKSQGQKLVGAAGKVGEAFKGTTTAAPTSADAQKYVVKAGDTLSGIAASFGLGLSGWVYLYNHPVNAEFKKKHPDPNKIKPGDTLFIPAKGEIEGAKKTLKIKLVENSGKPYGGVEVKLTCSDGSVKWSKLDAKGEVAVVGLPPGDVKVTFPGLKYPWSGAPGDGKALQIHTVKQGDTLSGLAKKYGVSTWSAIYADPANADFRKKRPNPDLIFPGDKIVIPSEKPKETVVPAGGEYTFKVLVPGTKVSEDDFEDAEEAQDNPKPKPTPGGGSSADSGATPPPKPAPKPSEPPKDQVKPSEDPNAEFVLLFDASSGLVHRVPTAMYEEMKKNHKLLAKLKQALKDADKLPQDQRKNAVGATMKQLEDICNVKPDPHGLPIPKEDDYLVYKGRAIRELWDAKERKFVYAPAKLQDALQQKFKNWKSAPFKDVAEVDKAAAPDPKKKVPFEIKFSTSWAGGEGKWDGSLLDWIDSSDPAQWVPLVLGNPAMAPVVLLDWAAEKFPTWLRKNHQGKWGWTEQSKRWDGGYEARFLRWTFETPLEVVLSPSQKQFKITGKAAGTVSLASGKADLSWSYPSKDGWSIGLPVKDKSRDYKVRFTISGTISGFVGATAELSAEAIADWSAMGEAKAAGSKLPVQIGLGTEFRAFAGASVTGELGLSIEWFNLESQNWKSLGRVLGQATGFVGAAAEFVFKIGWDSKRSVFTSEFKAGLALKVGAGAGVKVEIDVNEIMAFIGGMLKDCDYGYLQQVAQEAFEKFSALAIGMAAKAATKVTDAVWAAANGFRNWAANQSEVRQLAININSGLARPLMLYGSPEAKGAVIGKLCERSSLLPDETEEEAIIKVLSSIPTRNGFMKTLERVVPGKKSVQAGIDRINGCVDFGEQDQFDALLKKFSIA